MAAFLRDLVADKSGLTFDISEWPAIFQALMAVRSVSPAAGGHPRLFIWGALESRLQTVDTMVIGGLNEGSCKMIAPSLDEIAAELQGKVKIAKINIDENPELATQFGVRSIPTLLMFNNGEVVSNMVGAAPKSRLADWIKEGVK